MSTTTEQILQDLINWINAVVDKAKVECDRILQLKDNGISIQKTCEVLIDLYNHVTKALEDYERLAMNIAMYVASRALTRAFQIEVEKATLDKLVQLNIIPSTKAANAEDVLDTEDSVVRTRWSDFNTKLQNAFNQVPQKIDDALNYILTKINEVCQGYI